MTSVVWLLRHAEARKAPGQSPDDLFSLADLGLSERGLEQARGTAERLAREPFEAVYASPAQRAQETARIVSAPHKLDVRTDERLRELPLPRGDYEATLHAILEIPGRFRRGEAAFAHERRAFAEALVEISDRHGCCAVVAHGLQNRAWLSDLRGVPLDEILTIEQDHAAVTRIERTRGLWSL